MDGCFPPEHILHPVINRNTVKLSYSCLPNIGTIIASKNSQLLKRGLQVPTPCEFLPDECPVGGKFSLTGVIYQATVRADNQVPLKYIGLTEKSFKERYRKHLSSFTVHDPRNSTTLSKNILELQRKHVYFEIDWKIIERAKPYNAGDEECRLCIKEIYHILFNQSGETLNSRQEFTNKCRHQNKFRLCNN